MADVGRLPVSRHRSCSTIAAAIRVAGGPSMRLRLSTVAFLMTLPPLAWAQQPLSPTPVDPERVYSLGQPPIIRGAGFLSAGTYSRGDETLATGYLHLSGYK